MNIKSPAELSDPELLASAKCLVQSERQATAALVVHLAEIERRKLYLEEGCRSLFSYCTRVLHLSEHAAYKRIEAARVAVRIPAVLNSLERGDVHLTAVQLLGPLLTPENHRGLLVAAKHKSKREIEELIARLRPQADVPVSVRKLPVRKPEENRAAEPATDLAVQPELAPAIGARPSTGPSTGAATGAASGSAARSSSGSGPAPRPGVVVPLAPERYKIQFTASGATCEKLRRAQELLRHRIPNGDLNEIFDQALDLLVRDLEKKKFAGTDRPRQVGPATPVASRHIPAAVKRTVWQRDQGRCTFVSHNGARCCERGELEFDHIRPHADGGNTSVGNVRLLCRRHNQYESQRFFGLWQAEGEWNSTQR